MVYKLTDIQLRLIEGIKFQYGRYPTVKNITKSVWSQELGFHSLGEILIYFGFSPIQCWHTVCLELNRLNSWYYKIELNSMKTDIDNRPSPILPPVYELNHMPYGLKRTCTPSGTNI